MPPQVPAPPPQFQTFSESQDPPGLVVVKVVPPTSVMYGLSAGNGMGPVNASESPQALKNAWPCAAISRKIWSPAGSGGPPPQEQLICLERLSLAMRLSRSTHGLGLGAS